MNRKYFQSLLLVIIFSSIFFYNSCSSSSSDDQPSGGVFTEMEQAEMLAIVKDSMNRNGYPGILAGVWTEDRGVWTTATGFSDVDNKTPLDITYKTRIGSLSKTFTATVVLQLADEGIISLDAPISNYVDSIPNSSNITVRQLLNMGSGLYSYTDVPSFRTAIINDPLRVWTPDELISMGVNDVANPVFPPGEGFAYSNTNYVILGKLIERVTNNSVANEFQKRIFTPLNLKSTFFATNPEIIPPYMHGYFFPDTGGMVDYTFEDPSQAWTAGAVISNLSDLKTFVEAMVKGTLLSHNMQRERMTFNPYSVGNFDMKSSYGLGIFCFPNGFWGHDGGITGYNSCAYYHPSRKITIVVLGNATQKDIESGGVDGIFINLGKIVAPDLNWNFADN